MSLQKLLYTLTENKYFNTIQIKIMPDLTDDNVSCCPEPRDWSESSGFHKSETCIFKAQSEIEQKMLSPYSEIHKMRKGWERSIFILAGI